jgi:uncharacterized membrane protein
MEGLPFAVVELDVTRFIVLVLGSALIWWLRRRFNEPRRQRIAVWLVLSGALAFVLFGPTGR